MLQICSPQPLFLYLPSTYKDSVFLWLWRVITLTAALGSEARIRSSCSIPPICPSFYSRHSYQTSIFSLRYRCGWVLISRVYLVYFLFLFWGNLILFYVILQLLYTRFGGNVLVNLLGSWSESQYPASHSIPVGGLAYYITAPSR